MLFSRDIQGINMAVMVLAGLKTSTMRLKKPGEYRPHSDIVATPKPGGIKPYRIKWRVGRDYAVQPGRGQFQVGRFLLQNIDEMSDVRGITDQIARDEGFSSKEVFLKGWLQINGQNWGPVWWLRITPCYDPRLEFRNFMRPWGSRWGCPLCLSRDAAPMIAELAQLHWLRHVVAYEVDWSQFDVGGIESKAEIKWQLATPDLIREWLDDLGWSGRTYIPLMPFCGTVCNGGDVKLIVHPSLLGGWEWQAVEARGDHYSLDRFDTQEEAQNAAEEWLNRRLDKMPQGVV